MRIFHKAITANVVHFNNQKVRWEPVSGTDGVLALDDVRDSALIAELDRLADAKRKGVRRISAETRDNLKKNTPRTNLVELPKIRVFNPERLLPQKSSASSGPSAPVVVNVPPAPVFTQSSAAQQNAPPSPPPMAPTEEPPTPKPPAKPRTMKKSALKKLEEKQTE